MRIIATDFILGNFIQKTVNLLTTSIIKDILIFVFSYETSLFIFESFIFLIHSQWYLNIKQVNDTHEKNSYN